MSKLIRFASTWLNTDHIVSVENRSTKANKAIVIRTVDGEEIEIQEYDEDSGDFIDSILNWVKDNDNNPSR